MKGVMLRHRRAGAALGLLLAPLLALTEPLSAQAPGDVRGEVRSEQGGAPLRAAVVEVLGSEPRRVAADSAGRYLLRGVPAGRRVIRATFLGHAPLEVEVMVPAGREVRVDLSLRVEPVALAPVRVEAGRALAAGVDTLPARAAELGIAGARALEATPGLAELGLADAVGGRVPGQEPVDPTDVLYVRGAAADLKLVYLDGAPVYAPFPLGGLQEVFAPGLLRSADVYLGGAPAQYDGGLSYVMDLRTRSVRPEAAHSEGALDLLSGRALVEVPLAPRVGVLAAGRTVHGLGAMERLPYGYREGLVRVDVGAGEGVLRVTGFGNAEEVWLDTPDSTIVWGNRALAVQYRGRVLGEEAELSGSLGSFQAELPINGTRPLLAQGAARRARLAADFSRRAGDDLRVRYGFSWDRLRQRYRARVPADTAPEPRGGWTDAEGDALGAYGDLAWQPLPRVRVRGGLRANHFSLGGEWVLAPRLSATWMLSDRAALTLAGGRYHQYVRAPEDVLLEGSADSTGGPGVAPLALGRASHLALGLDQELGEGIRFGVEGFFKEFQGMPGAQADEANASGVDLWVRRAEGGWTGWLGYSLAWIWSAPLGSGANQFAGRQLVSAGVDVPLGERSQADLRFTYGAGLPYSAIPVQLSTDAAGIGLTAGGREATPASQLNGGADAAPLLPSPDQPYLRLDLSASRRWTPRWLGSRVEIASYLKLLNTLGGRDALFYRFDPDQDARPRALAVLPVVPVVGMEWKF